MTVTWVGAFRFYRACTGRGISYLKFHLLRIRKAAFRGRRGSGGAVEDNSPVLEDWAHNLNVEEYKAEQKVYNEQVLAWKENKAKCYYLVLSHCPQALEHQLKNSSSKCNVCASSTSSCGLVGIEALHGCMGSDCSGPHCRIAAEKSWKRPLYF